jgi:hypothetical protein
LRLTQHRQVALVGPRHVLAVVICFHQVSFIANRHLAFSSHIGKPTTCRGLDLCTALTSAATATTYTAAATPTSISDAATTTAATSATSAATAATTTTSAMHCKPHITFAESV